MTAFDELKLHVNALKEAIERSPKFFASIIHYVRRLDELLAGPAKNINQKEIQVLSGSIEKFYAQWRPTGGSLYIPPRETSDTDDCVLEINRIVGIITSWTKEQFDAMLAMTTGNKSTTEELPVIEPTTPCVFIGHGRSKLWSHVKMFLEDEMNLATVAYESESRAGESIVPILEKMLDQASFAVLVFTAEDESGEGKKRARQNVIHEAGLFQGRLGFRKVVLLVQEGIESFSNIDGLQYIPFSDERIEQAYYELQRVLKREQMLA